MSQILWLSVFKNVRGSARNASLEDTLSTLYESALSMQRLRSLSMMAMMTKLCKAGEAKEPIHATAGALHETGLRHYVKWNGKLWKWNDGSMLRGKKATWCRAAACRAPNEATSLRLRSGAGILLAAGMICHPTLNFFIHQTTFCP